MGMMVALHAADEHTLGAYRAGPEDAARGLVIVQEIFGVNSYIRRVCDRFAARGYAVIAPALFDRAEREVELGYTPEDMQIGRALRAQVPRPARSPTSRRRRRRCPSVRHPGLLLGRHGRLVGRDAHELLRRRGRLVWRRHL